jgi:hypothetical protein
MTKNEMLKMIVEGAVVTAEMAEKAAEILAADAKAKEARKGKVSEKEQAKRDANEAMALYVVKNFITAEAKTASDIAELINADATLAAQLEKPANSQKATALMKIAMAKELVSQIDVKIPKKGSVKAYTAVEAE